MTGTLYVVATPIGNLADITHRAAKVLSEVATVACEDTRQTRKLLDYLGVHPHLVSYHEHNERERAAELLARLSDGESIALVSDAGTPLVSDPGYRLVSDAVAAGIPVVPIPGASALLAALSASGLPSDAFYFGGFLPPKAGRRRKTLEALAGLPATLIFYEAPHRVLEMLEDVSAVLGDRPVVLARELTKVHEEFLRGTASVLRAQLAQRESIKGECTVLIGKGGTPVHDDTPVEEAVAQLEAQGVSRMDAIKRIARERGLGKREVYDQVRTRIMK